MMGELTFGGGEHKNLVGGGGLLGGFSNPRGTKKLNKLPRAKKALIIPMCCSCLTITFVLISEQPTNTS